jgi:general secretion pathway protein B
MSVILDVLRKLDREKSSRRSAAANIALEILKPDPPRSQKRNPLYFATVGLTALAAAAITYALMGSGFLSKSPSPKPVNPPTTSQEIATTPRDPVSLPKSSLPPAKSPPAPSQRVAPDPPPLESGRDAREGISRVPPEVRTPAENKIPAISPVDKETSKSVILEKANVAPKINSEELTESTPTPPQKAPGTSVVTPPSLKISAIIWYEDPSKRFAMINDTMTHEGSVIEEVMVEEIYPNRVRFSHNGRHFEISVK